MFLNKIQFSDATVYFMESCKPYRFPWWTTNEPSVCYIGNIINMHKILKAKTIYGKQQR